MRVYEVSWSDPCHGTMRRWRGSKRAARQEVVAVLREYDGEVVDVDPTVQAHDIPTHKGGLLAWLDFHASTDNG